MFRWGSASPERLKATGVGIELKGVFKIVQICDNQTFQNADNFLSEGYSSVSLCSTNKEWF